MNINKNIKFIDTGQATFLKAAIPISYSEKSCIKIEDFFFFSVAMCLLVDVEKTKMTIE